MSAQHVTHPRLRNQVARMLRIALDLLTHPPHVHPRQVPVVVAALAKRDKVRDTPRIASPVDRNFMVYVCREFPTGARIGGSL